MSLDNRIWADVKLSAIKDNLYQLKKQVEQCNERSLSCKPKPQIDSIENETREVLVMAVVKANGYGHGGVAVANYLKDEPFVWGFGVATIDEAIELRNGGIEKPILVVGCVFPDEYMDMISYDIMPTVYTLDAAKEMNEVAKIQGKTIKIHIEVDTGMGRLGFLPTKESACEVAKIFEMPNIIVDGMYIHYACADDVDLTFTIKQHQEYLDFINSIKEMGELDLPNYHCCNSAGAIAFPTSGHNLIRPGISSYGYFPDENMNKNNVILKPALSLYSQVTFVKEVPKGTPIGYGSTFITPKPMKIATIPVGYGDGYPRALSNVGDVLIGGKRCRIIGRVCMDQFMVDVTHVPNVEFMDLVVLIGVMGEEEITLEELSRLSNRFNYEFLCCLGNRIKRKYIT